LARLRRETFGLRAFFHKKDTSAFYCSTFDDDDSDDEDGEDEDGEEDDEDEED